MNQEFEEQFAQLLTEGQFSEEATILLEDGTSTQLRGVFYSGSYEEASSAAYAPKRLVGRDYLQVSSAAFGDMPRPWESLKGATVEVRDAKFRIYDVSGRRSAMLTLELQEKREEDGDV